MIFKACKVVIRRERGSNNFEILVTSFMDAPNTLFIAIEALKIPSKTLSLKFRGFSRPRVGFSSHVEAQSRSRVS